VKYVQKLENERRMKDFVGALPREMTTNKLGIYGFYSIDTHQFR
jgi:hypothetical protein